MPLEQGVLISCVRGRPINLDLASLSPSDRMWLAHMFTYRLHEGFHDHDHSDFDTFVTELIHVSLLDLTSPGRLVADCLLAAGLLLGLTINRRHLARLDKRWGQLDCSAFDFLTTL